jgi:hypothetical protein
MRYLVIDEQYRIYQTDIFSGYLRTQVKKGKLSVVNLQSMQGMDRDGRMEDIQEWEQGYRVEALSA